MLRVEMIDSLFGRTAIDPVVHVFSVLEAVAWDKWPAEDRSRARIVVQRHPSGDLALLSTLLRCTVTEILSVCECGQRLWKVGGGDLPAGTAS